jgi:hypothetical protein
MIPPQQYIPAARSAMQDSVSTNTAKPIMSSSYGSPYASPLVASPSISLKSYLPFNAISRPLNTREVLNDGFNLNTNEYVPAASSRVSTSMLYPKQVSSGMTAFKPSKYQMITQRA